MNTTSIPAEWLPQYSYKDYKQWEGHWELIYGLPHAMSPSPKRKHQLCERRFLRIVEDALGQNTNVCHCDVYHELDWIVDDNTVVRPDVMIVCGKFEDDFLRFPPTLILEIASDTTRLKDRNIKFNLYQNNGVKYYLIADVERESIDMFILKDNRYTEFNSDTFTLTSACSIQLNIQKIWQ